MAFVTPVTGIDSSRSNACPRSLAEHVIIAGGDGKYYGFKESGGLQPGQQPQSSYFVNILGNSTNLCSLLMRTGSIVFMESPNRSSNPSKMA